MSKKAERLVLGFIIIGYLILAWSYAQGPLFEPPDEDLHYDYIRVLAHEHKLPDPYSKEWSQYPQPPAYYLLSAPILALLPDDDFKDRYWVMRDNPYAGELVDVPHHQNRNMYLHDRSEQFPYKNNDSARNTQVLRWFSMLLGLGTLYFSYQIFQILWPQNTSRRLLAMGIMAFWPLFLRMAGALNNDNLVYLVATIAIYLLLLQIQNDPTLKLNIILGVVLGIALMTKSYTGFLAIPVGAWVITDKRTWRYVPIILVLTVTIGGWWYLHNIIVYGNATFYDHPQVQDFSIKGDNSFVLDYAIDTFPLIFHHFWAHYHMIVVHEPLYIATYTIGIIGIVGLLYRGIRFAMEARHEKWSAERWLMFKQGLVMTAFVGAWFLMIFYVCGTIKVGYQGRYALGAIAGIAGLLALGLETWIPQRWQRPFALTGIAALASLATIVFAGYYRAAFTVLPPPDEIEYEVAYRYEDAVELIGVKQNTVGGQPGDLVEIDAYWRALHPANSENWVVAVTAFGSTELRKHSYPGGGNLLATDWQAGEEWTERYFMEIPAGVETQKVYPLTIGLFDLVTNYIPPVTDASGSEAFPVVGRFVVHGRPIENPEYRYNFSDKIGLQVESLVREGDSIETCVDWVSLKTIRQDLHYFLHVYQGEEFFTQSDGQPRNGEYPTDVWLAGEVIDDCMILDVAGLANEGWSVKIGLYDRATLQRLAVRDETGTPLANDWVSLTLDSDGAVVAQ